MNLHNGSCFHKMLMVTFVTISHIASMACSPFNMLLVGKQIGMGLPYFEHLFKKNCSAKIDG